MYLYWGILAVISILFYFPVKRWVPGPAAFFSCSVSFILAALLPLLLAYTDYKVTLLSYGLGIPACGFAICFLQFRSDYLKIRTKTPSPVTGEQFRVEIPEVNKSNRDDLPVQAVEEDSGETVLLEQRIRELMEQLPALGEIGAASAPPEETGPEQPDEHKIETEGEVIPEQHGEEIPVPQAAVPVDMLITTGISKRRAGEYARAAKDLCQAIAREPGRDLLYLAVSELSSVYLYMGFYPLAVELLSFFLPVLDKSSHPGAGLIAQKLDYIESLYQLLTEINKGHLVYSEVPEELKKTAFDESLKLTKGKDE